MNYYGMYTLYLREVLRFLKVYNQTLIAPLINSLLFLAIFSLALRGRLADIQGVPLQQFIIPGLIMMTVLQNAFANTSSTLTFGKVLGIIIDVLIPPLSPREITIAMSLGGASRGILSGIVVVITIYIIGTFAFPGLAFEIQHWGLLVFYLFFASLTLSLIGMVAGIFSDSFDQMSAITSYVITPLSFLSGTFYSIKNLPEFWQQVNYFNPFFYMIDGFRYSFTGHNDASIETGMAYIIGLNIVLFIAVYLMLKKGYRIKS